MCISRFSNRGIGGKDPAAAADDGSRDSEKKMSGPERFAHCCVQKNFTALCPFACEIRLMPCTFGTQFNEFSREPSCVQSARRSEHDQRDSYSIRKYYSTVSGKVKGKSGKKGQKSESGEHEGRGRRRGGGKISRKGKVLHERGQLWGDMTLRAKAE